MTERTIDATVDVGMELTKSEVVLDELREIAKQTDDPDTEKELWNLIHALQDFEVEAPREQ